MALRIFFSPRLLVSLVSLWAIGFPAQGAAALRAREAGRDLPALAEFAQAVANGNQDELRGAYVPGIFADLVVQQPEGNPAFVSPRGQVLTRFSEASRLDSIGLLAHNYLAGRDFSQLTVGQRIYLVYGDGRMRSFDVTRILKFQALQPLSTQSEFIDLATGKRLGAAALFTTAYGRQGSLVFQTCIEAEGIEAWGRLFVVAEPSAPEAQMSPQAPGR